MFKQVSPTVIRHLFAGAALAALVLTPATAHVRRHAHRHGHVQRHRPAVIVVGKPRALRTAVVIDGRPHGSIDFAVKPRTTEVWVDGHLRGTVDDFDGSPQKLHLLPGSHVIKLVAPDAEPVQKTISITAGTELDLKLNLES